MADLQPQQQQALGDANRPRRATYVHVSDVTSAYNIDHTLLEQELARVMQESMGGRDLGAGTANRKTERLAGGVPAELDTSQKKRLQPPKGGSNMVVLVGKIRVVVDKNRVDGSRVRLAEVEVGDETGTVSLRARDNQIDTLNEISSRNGAVVLRNCTLELYQGKHIRLAVTKWGKLSPYPDAVASTPAAPSKINRERNFSLIDLSLVASETPDGAGHNTEPYENMQRTPTSQTGSRNYSGQHRNRTPMHRSHGRQIMGPPQGMHYMDNNLRMNQYGQDGSMSAYGSYGLPPSQPYYTSVTNPDQESALRAHQHQMMQHHHHHQLRMQQSSLSYSPRQQPAQRRDNQGRTMPPTSPMMLPGSSYTPEVQSIHMPPPAAAAPPGAYLIALQQQHQQPRPQLQQQQQHDAHQHSNDSAFMNPQAASFDPATYPPAK